MQWELFAHDRQPPTSAANNFYGGYAFVSYFLTGENRPYNRKMGVFDRVKPYEDFFRVRDCDGNVSTGHGAWELAYRFSYIDMLDGMTRTKGRQARSGRRPHHRRELVSESLHQGHVQLRPFIDTSNVAIVDPVSGKTTGHACHRRKPGYFRDAVRNGFLTTPWEPSFVTRKSTDNSCATTTAYFNVGDNVMRTSAMILLLTVLVLGSRPATATDCAGGTTCCCDQCGRQVPCVEKTCQVVCEMKKETKTCWCVECQEICPLMPGCHHGCCDCPPPPRCGHPKCVKKAVKKEYQVEKFPSTSVSCCTSAPIAAMADRQTLPHRAQPSAGTRSPGGPTGTANPDAPVKSPTIGR